MEECEIIDVDGLPSDAPNKQYVLRVKSRGFLWRQVRYMVQCMLNISTKKHPMSVCVFWKD